MRRSRSSQTLWFLLKIVVVFLLFVLIVCVPWLKVWAASDGSSQAFNVNEAIGDILQMMGGGGIGVAGSAYLNKQQRPPSPQWDNSDNSGFNLNSTAVQSEVKELERRWLKDSQIIRNHQKKLQSKINAIEFFLGKKFDDFNRKDTMH
ncbi:MAG: hypothetical protein QNJ42_19090 [Crocosphaera sp.]|nr:hypothetical protein [Crocosphaera sp.]